MWNLRWNTIPYEKLQPEDKRQYFSIDPESQFDFKKMVLIPLGFYYVWVIVYYLINFKLGEERIRTRNYMNIHRFYMAKQWYRDLMSKYTNPGVVFIAIHFSFWTVAHFWAILCYQYYAINTFAILLWLTVSIWNSAGYYFQYFSKKYEISL